MLKSSLQQQRRQRQQRRHLNLKENLGCEKKAESKAKSEAYNSRLALTLSGTQSTPLGETDHVLNVRLFTEFHYLMFN